MAFHPVSHGIEVALHFRMDGQELVNTIGFYSNLAAPTLAQVTAANAICTGDFLTDLLLLMHASCQFYKSVSTALDTAGSPQFIFEDVANGAITASDPLPLSVAALIAGKTAHRGKGETAHVYVGALTEGATEGDNLSAGAISDLTTTFDNLPLAPTGDGIQWAMLSRHFIIAYPIVSYSVRPYVAVQKLRLPGRRRRRHTP